MELPSAIDRGLAMRRTRRVLVIDDDRLLCELIRTTFELVPQTFVMPVQDFAAAAPGFDAGAVKAVRLKFDRTEKGTVILTSLGIGAAKP